MLLLGFALPARASEGGSHLFIPDAIWLPVNLAVFLFFLYWFVGRPIARFLESRKESIATELSEAESKLVQAEELRAQVLERLEQVEGEMVELKQRAEREGQEEAERIAAESEAEEERFLRRLDDEIVRRRVETRNALAQETAALTAQLAHELLEREMTEADRKRILERSLRALQTLAEEE
jgi:F-type H+-transporting ATPase subunit b